MLKCPKNCEGWRVGFAHFVWMIEFISKHGYMYGGEDFRYCPWCREKLKEDGETDEQA